MPQRDNKWDAFKSWCTKNAIPIEKFTIKKVNNKEYGLFANANFNQNDILMELPRKVFMTNETAKEDPKLGLLVP